MGRLRKEEIITHSISLLDPREIGLKITAIALVKIDAEYVVESSWKLAAFKEAHHLFESN